jgi:hypothetical protein
MMNPHALPGNLFTRHPGLERTYGSAARATLFQFAFRINTGNALVGSSRMASRQLTIL